MNRVLLLIIFFTGIIWLRSGFTKLTSGFTGTLDKILMKFASENPYPFVKEFLISVAVPNHVILSYLTEWGEFFAGVVLIFSALYLIFTPKPKRIILLIFSLGLLIGALLSLIFWFSAGWMSPSTDGLNLLMFVIEVSALFWVISNLKK